MKTLLMKKIRQTLSRAPYHQSPALVLAVSGGVDSMVLLDVFCRMQHVHQSPLLVAHVHHHSGRFSDVSERLVRAFCETRRIPMTTGHFRWDGRGNFEFEAARFRRTFLEQTRRDDQWIVLAHHQDDQLETFFLAMIRGASIAGPVGMQAETDWRLRPFLDCRRSWILDHARRADVPHALDPTNYDLNRLRNRLRHRLLPPLEDVHRHIGDRVSAWMNDLAQLQQAMSSQAHRILDRFGQCGVLQRDAFRQSPRMLWPFLLHAFWSVHDHPPLRHEQERRVLDWLDHDRCGQLDLANARFHCDLDGLTIWKNNPIRPRAWRHGEPADWGPLRFRITFTTRGIETLKPWASILMNQGGTLLPAGELPKKNREVLRHMACPHRFRAILPQLRADRKTAHLTDFLIWAKSDLLRFESLGEPDGLSRPFDHCIAAFLA